MRTIRLLGVAFVLVLAVGCSGAAATADGDPPVDLDEATAMAESALAAFNDGDYDAFILEPPKNLAECGVVPKEMPPGLG